MSAPDASSAISVVIPTYGRAEYLLAAIDSVLAQTRPPGEIIVVDDGSPDDTGARVAPLVQAGRVRYVRRENGGMAAARNTGAALATREFLLFLDDDDLLVPTALEAMVDELAARPDYGFVYGGWIRFAGVEPPPIPDVRQPQKVANRTAFLIFNKIGSSGMVLMRRAAFEAVGRWQTRHPGVEDWDLWLRLLARYPALNVGRPVLLYRLHGNNMSRDIARMYRSSFGVARSHLAALPPDRRVVIRRFTYDHLHSYHAPLLAEIVVHAARARQWRRALRSAWVWAFAWVAGTAARVALRAHLVRRGL